MKTMKRGTRTLSRYAIHKTVFTPGREIDNCTLEYYSSFERWARANHFGWDSRILLRATKQFWQTWLGGKPSAQKWLVKNNFAEWAEPEFEPIHLKIESLEELKTLWHKCNVYSHHVTYDFAKRARMSHGLDLAMEQPEIDKHTDSLFDKVDDLVEEYTKRDKKC